jgi:hypothetical protein
MSRYLLADNAALIQSKDQPIADENIPPRWHGILDLLQDPTWRCGFDVCIILRTLTPFERFIDRH